VVGAWRQAAHDLGVRFSAPFIFTCADGKRVECLGLVHQFGRRVGTVISVLGQPSASAAPPVDPDYFTSTLGTGYGEYQRQWFIDTLDDWQFFGPDSERPSWYTGKSWT